MRGGGGGGEGGRSEGLGWVHNRSHCPVALCCVVSCRKDRNGFLSSSRHNAARAQQGSAT